VFSNLPRQANWMFMRQKLATPRSENPAHAQHRTVPQLTRACLCDDTPSIGTHVTGERRPAPSSHHICAGCLGWSAIDVATMSGNVGCDVVLLREGVGALIIESRSSVLRPNLDTKGV